MSTTAMYKQPGPSNPNFAKSYSNEGRPPWNNRGRGRNAHMNGGYRQPQQQPYYPYQPMNGSSMHDPYAPMPNVPAPLPHAGPSFNNPTSPALHPIHAYNPHAPPFIPQGPLPPPPMYPYPTHPVHMTPYAAYPSPLPQPHYMYYQQPKSPASSHTPEMSDQPQPVPQPFPIEHDSFQPVPDQPAQFAITRAPLASTSYSTSSTSASPSVSENPPQPDTPHVSRPSSPHSPTVVHSAVHSRTASASSSRAVLPSFSDLSLLPRQEWVISSHRPDNPSSSFGIVFSPKANPPAHIIAEAQDFQMPKPSKASLKARPRPVRGPRKVPGPSPILSVGTSDPVEAKVPANDGDPDPDPTNGDPVSCSGTESDSRASTAPDTFIAGSPVSTATSISLAAQKGDVEMEQATMSAPAPTLSSTSVAQEKDAPVRLELPKPKKLWASLLRSDDPSVRTSSLPTSSVQGFSIPGYDNSQQSQASAPSTDETDSGLLRLLTQGPGGSMTAPQIRPRGLVNTGNMCFANAVLQTLVYTPPFFRLFNEIGKHIERTGAGSLDPSGRKTPLIDAMTEFLKEFKPKPKATSKNTKQVEDDDFDGVDSFIPSYVYDAMKEKKRFDGMGGGQQEDAEEFFGFFLDSLEEELLAVSKSLSPPTPAAKAQSADDEDDWLEVGKKNKAVITRTAKAAETPLSRIFGGKFRIALRVPGQQRDSVTLEDWRSLHVEIQREEINMIEDALRYISRPNAVPVSSVTKGGATVEASQQYLFDTFPPVLVLHLKRFEYDMNVKDVVKISKQITYGPELEIPNDIINPIKRTSQPVKYKLYAAVYHHGPSAARGHYTLDVLHPNRNSDSKAKPREGWIRIDDELVSDMRTEDVFPKERDCAYLLFYRRIGGTYASRV